MLLGRTNKGNPLKGLCYAWIEDFACRRFLVHGPSGVHSAYKTRQPLRYLLASYTVETVLRASIKYNVWKGREQRTASGTLARLELERKEAPLRGSSGL